VLAQRTRIKAAKMDSLKDAATEETAPGEKQQLKRQVGDLKENERKTNEGLELYFGQGAFYSIDGDTSSMANFDYKFINPEEYGIITCNVLSQYTSYLIQLIDKNNTIVKEVKDLTSFVFNLVPPDAYKIRVLIDSNNNGTWDLGNMSENRLPEPVYFFPEEIAIRANWELNIELSF
jgi:hypothetical protein